MTNHNVNFTVPITNNVVFALRLDIKKDIEHVVIGELKQVLRYMRGFPCEVLVDERRPFAAFILECSQPMARELADVRAVLSDSTGKKKSPMLEKAKGTLEQMWRSDNLVYKYVSMRIWQEYNKACTLKEYDLYGAIEAITLPMMLSLESEIRHWQENMPQNPLIELIPEYFNHPALVLYTGRKLYEYHAADLSLLPLVVYYLKTVYNEKTYFQTCKRCGRLFRANTANIASFCGEECKKAQVRDNKRRFDEKAKDMPCERAYKTQYMFWYNRMTKLRKSNKNGALLEEAESMFAAFREEATSRKKDVVEGNQSEREFEDWMFEQGTNLDRLMER